MNLAIELVKNGGAFMHSFCGGKEVNDTDAFATCELEKITRVKARDKKFKHESLSFVKG
jgi:hypothetical protein